MSLMKKRPRTAKRILASHANGKRSHGPVTQRGRERSRDAHLRHGLYSADGNKALRVLGEKPEEFDAVVACVMEQWQPANGFEERLSMRLARAIWRMERADRMQEGYALQQAQETNQSRADRLHARMMRLKMTESILERLLEAVRDEDYEATPDDIEIMRNLYHEGVLKEMGEIAVALLEQLQPADEEDVPEPPVDPRTVRANVRAVFGLRPGHDYGMGPYAPHHDEPVATDAEGGVTPVPGSPDTAPPPPEVKPPEITPPPPAEEAEDPEEREAHEKVRRLLEHILVRQAEICREQRRAVLRESLEGPSPYERAMEIAPAHRNVAVVRRMEDSSFRQVARLTNLLLKVKRRNWKMWAELPPEVVEEK